MLVGRDLGLPNLVVLVVIFVIFPAIGFVIRRKWLHAAARSEEIKRLLIFASEEAARAEIEATEGHFYTSNTSPSVPSPPSAWVPAPDSGWVQPTVSTPPVAPSLKPPYQCAVCFSPTSTRCAKCKAARYCSGRCQIIHWRQGHKDECRPYVAVKPVKDISATSSDSHATSTDGIGSAFDSSSSEEYSTFSTPSRASTEASSVSSGDSDVNFVNVESSTASVKVDQSQPSHSDEDIHPRFSTSSSQVYDVPGPSSRPSFSDPSTTSSGFLGGTHHSKKSSIDELDSSSKNTTMLDNPAPNGSGRHKSNDEIMSKEMPFNGLMSTKPPKHNSEMFKETKISSPSIKDSKPFGSMPPAVPGKSTHMVNAKSVTSSPLKSTSRLASQYTKPLTVHEEKDKVSSFSSKLAEHSRSGRNEIKTSMLKVVDQPKPSKLTRHHTQRAESETTHKSSCKGLFSYDAFVKLYNWNQIGLRPFGLINCGNSCYANSVLQCLTHTPPLYAYFLQGLHSKACHKRDWCFTCEFEGLVLKAKNGSSSLSPIRILSQIENIGSSLNHGTQEDAHEFLRYAIDALQSVCLKEAGAKATNSLEEETTLVGLTFGGYLRSKIKCMKCGGKSERHDRMMDLTVEIEGNIGTLEEALNKFTCTEILDGENKYKCSRCKSYERAKKKLTLLEAPNVLTIALKRFQSGKYGKLNKSIDFPEILDMAPYVSGTSDKSPVYKLYGAVVHLDTMNAAFSGHYVCYVKNVENRWYKIDDYKVKEVDVQSVLKKGAYLLLYARCSPRAPKLIRSLLSRDHHDPRKHKMLLRSQHQRPTQPWDDHLAIRHRSLEEESSSSSDGSGILSESCSCSTESSQRTSSSIEDHIPWDWEHDEHSNSNSISSSPLWRNLHLNSSDSDTSSSSSSSSSFRPPLLYSRHSTLYHNDSSNSFRDVDRLGGRPTEPAKPALRRSTGRVRSE